MLRGDLDWIVMKCLEKDRTRRYETANGLAADLKRHLNNEPVVARPPIAAYKFQKVFRRNKVSFAAGDGGDRGLVLGIIASTWQSVRATRAKQEALAATGAGSRAQRQQADAARSQAEGLVAFMIQDLQPALKDYGRLSLLKQVDEKTVNYYAALPPELRNAKTELARADAIEALAEILASSGDMKSAAAKGGEALALYQGPGRAASGNSRSGGRSAEPRVVCISQPILPIPRPNWTRFSRTFSAAGVNSMRNIPENHKVRTGLGGALWNRAYFAAERFNKPQEAIAVGLELQEYDPRNGEIPGRQKHSSRLRECLGRSGDCLPGGRRAGQSRAGE